MTLESDTQSEFTDARIDSHSASQPQPELFISIHPRFTDKITCGSKTVEFRRKFPQRISFVGARVWIYSSSPRKAVVAMARISLVDRLPINELWRSHNRSGGIDKQTFEEYFAGTPQGVAIGLTSVITLDKEISLATLRDQGFHVPQSYRYVTNEVSPLLREAIVETAPRHKYRDCA